MGNSLRHGGVGGFWAADAQNVVHGLCYFCGHQQRCQLPVQILPSLWSPACSPTFCNSTAETSGMLVWVTHQTSAPLNPRTVHDNSWPSLPMHHHTPQCKPRCIATSIQHCQRAVVPSSHSATRLDPSACYLMLLTSAANCTMPPSVLLSAIKAPRVDFECCGVDMSDWTLCPVWYIAGL